VIRLKDPSLVAGLRPLAVDTRAVERGEDVAAFGFPLSDVIGADLTLTQGVVSKTPAPDNDNLLVLSAVVNPGNSGGPLCDTNGNAVGLITYKIGNEEGRSYGGAVPAGDVAAFLKKHIPDFRPPPLLKNNFTRNVWKEVDGIVSPSVLMILKVK
jgi:S1-C subfamily serine protease